MKRPPSKKRAFCASGLAMQRPENIGMAHTFERPQKAFFFVFFFVFFAFERHENSLLFTILRGFRVHPAFFGAFFPAGKCGPSHCE